VLLSKGCVTTIAKLSWSTSGCRRTRVN